MAHLHLTYSARRLSQQLVFVIALLAVCHVIVMIINYKIEELPWLLRELFDLDEEQSFGTWFSAVILLFAGRLLLLQAREVRDFWFAWKLLGIGFCFLSLDEVVGLHETFNSMTDFSWTLPGGIVAGVVGLAYIPFLRRLPSRTRWLFLLGGLIYVGGAVILERATDWYADENLLDTLEYNLTTVLEETMEMSGVAVFIYALLSHMARGKKTAGVDIEIRE